MAIREGLVDRMVAKEFMVHCVGLEHLVSSGDVSECCESVKKARKEHVRLVLREYTKQKKSGVFSPVMLAHVSILSSKSGCKKARARARVVAML